MEDKYKEVLKKKDAAVDEYRKLSEDEKYKRVLLESENKILKNRMEINKERYEMNLQKKDDEIALLKRKLRRIQSN